MYLYQNKPRFTQQGFIPGSSNHDKDTTSGKKRETHSSTTSTSVQLKERHTAEYLRRQARPPFEEGMQLVTTPFFQRFLQGEIPDDHAQQCEIAQTSIDYGFASALAWLFAKTEITEFIYRGSNHGDGILTLARTLMCPGLSLTSLIIEKQYFSTYELDDISSAINESDSIKTVNFSNTMMHEATLGFIKETKGRSGEIVITGGMVEVDPPRNSSLSAVEELPAAAFGPDWISKASRVQLIIQGRNAISAIESTRNIDMETLSEVRLPDISGFSNAVKTALKCFFRKAYAMPYFMLHTTFSSNMKSIFSSGSLTSRHRLETFSGESISSGLRDENDVKNDEHRMIFAAMGTNADNIQPPSNFEVVKKYRGLSSFLIDVDLFIQNNLPMREHMMVKSCDWGEILGTTDKKEQVKQIVSIPNTSISIIRLDMDGRIGAIQPDHMIKYKYENRESGVSKEYALPVYGDIATGANYRQLVPLLLVQHLRQLDETEQLAVLAGMREEENGSGEKKRNVEDILDAFSPLEISIPGSLPLHLEYVDLVKHDQRIFNIKEIRQAVQEGRIDEFVVLMENARYFPEGEAPDWLISGIHRIAMKRWLESGKQADRFLAILDFIEPHYQAIQMRRQSQYKPDYASLDLIKASEELNAFAVPPSSVNQLIVTLRAKQEKVEDYLTKNRDVTREALRCLQDVFTIKNDVSVLGLQSTLKTKMIESNVFGNLVENKDRIKSLIYLTSATPALIAKIFGPIDLEIFQAKNGYTGLNHTGHIHGIKNPNSQSPVNRSFLSDLLFNVPCNSLFVPGNGMPDNKGNPFVPKNAIRAASDYRLLFSALRNVLREENLINITPSTGEQLLRERYESSKWDGYKKRLQLLAELSRKGATIKDGGENRYLHNPSHVIRALSVMDPEYAHFNLDPHHLKAVLSGNYGKALPAFDALIEAIAANPEEDENHRTTATQLFHRMKLLEFEFYKDQLIDQVESGFDDYAGNVLASMNAE